MPLNIYYLDDEVGLCEIFYDFFSSEYIKITTFYDPNQAIKAIYVDPPDLLFIDYSMPEMNGDEVAAAVSKNIPKILVTGDIGNKHSKHYLRVIPKPFDFKVIQDVINHFLNNAALKR